MIRQFVITESNYDVFNVLGVYDDYQKAEDDLRQYRKKLNYPNADDYSIIEFDQNRLGQIEETYMNEIPRNK